LIIFLYSILFYYNFNKMYSSSQFRYYWWW